MKYTGLLRGLLVIVLVLSFASVALAQTQSPTTATAEMFDVQGRSVGTATLTQLDNGSVRVQVQVAGFLPGQSSHGIHFHDVGVCTPDFSAAGGHFNPTNRQHGLNNPEGPHAGDLPNMQFNADGSGSYDTTTDLITLTPGERSIFDANGTALIIHAGEDDQVTDPAGNSGDRIACGVLVAGAQGGTATAVATAAPMSTAAATAVPTSAAAATAAPTSAATATVAPAGTAAAAAATVAPVSTAAATGAAGTPAAPGTLPTTGGGGLMVALLALGGALIAGGGFLNAYRRR